MFKKEWLFYLIALVTLSWNLTYFIFVNVSDIENIYWSNVFNSITSKTISSTLVLGFPLISLVVITLSMIIVIILNVISYKRKKTSDFLATLFILPIAIVVSLIFSIYSQLYFNEIKQQWLSITISDMAWLSKELIWVLSTIIFIATLISLGAYKMKFKSVVNKNAKISDFRETSGNSSQIKQFESFGLEQYKFTPSQQSPQTTYIPSSNYAGVNGSTMAMTEDFNINEENNFYSDVTENIQFNKNINPPKLALSENDEFDNEFINNIPGINNFSDPQINDNINMNSINAGNVNVSSSIKPVNNNAFSNQQGFTEQIKDEYEKDFILVQELHRINMGQSNVRLTKLINIFYNRYERGLDLDIDRVMLLIYRAALDYEPLLECLKEAILYKLDSKFISDLARGWFKSYSHKVNSLYSINRQSFKKCLLEGITIMDNDIEKYLQNVNSN